MDNLSLKHDMDEKQLSIVQSELENQKKSMAVAYLLWFFFGGFGIHRFYTGRIGSGVAMVCLWGLGALTAWIFIGIPLLIAVYIWVLVDAFILHGIVNKMNQELERRILQKVSYM